MRKQPAKPGPYSSALDLPSVVEMFEQIRGAKLLTRIVARRQRPKVLMVEADLRRLVVLVDTFYELLGSRHWIFHENLNAAKIAALVHLPAAEAERQLIELHQEPESLEFMIRMLNRFPQLRARMPLIERARNDYEDGRYYSTVLVLLSVMDGFVNDLEAKHRGLHTRNEDEMHAWDSVVGHHLGLTNAHKTFTKTFSKTSVDEVRELFRNGIVHGVLLNFDNDVVASKAWNRLFAVADWAVSREKQERTPEPKSTFRELLSKIDENQRARRALNEWRPRVVTEHDAGFTSEPLFVKATEYLAAWQKRNYGKMAGSLSSLAAEETHGKTSGMVRDGCTGFELNQFTLRSLDFEAPAVCEIDVELIFGTEIKRGRMRWIREGDDGMAALPTQAGEWRLAPWGPLALINRAHAKKKAR